MRNSVSDFNIWCGIQYLMAQIYFHSFPGLFNSLLVKQLTSVIMLQKKKKETKTVERNTNIWTIWHLGIFRCVQSCCLTWCLNKRNTPFCILRSPQSDKYSHVLDKEGMQLGCFLSKKMGSYSHPCSEGSIKMRTPLCIVSTHGYWYPILGVSTPFKALSWSTWQACLAWSVLFTTCSPESRASPCTDSPKPLLGNAYKYRLCWQYYSSSHCPVE